MGYEGAVAAVAAGVFAAVAHLHERGIAHRDLKPSNVLVAPGGHPYLLDFNLASHLDDPWRLAGTLPYMAPEQLAVLASADASPPADARPGDVFACGVILFELLTGRHPFGAPSAPASDLPRNRAAAALLAAQRAARPDPTALNPRVPRAVRAALARCLAIDPHERPTAAELAEVFARAGARRARRFAVPVLAGAAVALAALGASYAALRTAPAAPAAAPALAAVQPAAAPAAPPAPAAFDRAKQLYQKGEYRLAAVEFVSAGRAEKDGRAYGYAAYCLSAGKDPVSALEVADEAIRLGYRTAPVYANRADNHLKAGRLPKAKDDCDEALRLDPGLLAARYTRAYVCLQLHLQKRAPIPPEAVADIESAAAVMPDAADVWDTAAQLYLLTSGDRDRAGRAVKKAVLAGKPPAVIKRNLVLKPLAGQKDYDEALTLSPARVDRPVSPHLANPLP
jgi:hypothetical protein